MSLDLTEDNQHWFRLWLGAVRQQAITWASVDLDLCRHMASLGHNELNGVLIFFFYVFFGLLALCEPAIHSFIFFIVKLNELLNKQLGCQWFEKSWHLCDVTLMTHIILLVNLPISNTYRETYNYGCFEQNNVLPMPTTKKLFSLS